MSYDDSDGGLFVIGVVLGGLVYLGSTYGWLGFVGGLFILFACMEGMDEEREKKAEKRRNRKR